MFSIFLIFATIKIIMYIYAATGGCVRWDTYGLFLTKLQCVEYKPLW